MHYWLVRHIQLLTFIDNYRDYYSNVMKGSLLYTRVLKLFGIENKGAYGFLNYCMEKDPEDVDLGWKILSETFRKMKTYAAKAGVKLYVLIIPHDIQISRKLYERNTRKYGHNPAEFDVEKPNRKLAELCESLDIDYLDLLPLMREEAAKGKQYYFIRDGHWNAKGHKFAAGEIYKDFKKMGWIK